MEFKLIGKYALNQLNKDKFSELMGRGIGGFLSDSYIDNKWESFCVNQLSFLVQYDELLREIKKEIINTEYKG